MAVNTAQSLDEARTRSQEASQLFPEQTWPVVTLPEQPSVVRDIEVVLKTYTSPAGMKVEKIDYDDETGQIKIEDLKSKVDDSTAAVYIGTPSYLGFVEENVKAIGEIAHAKKAIYITGVDHKPGTPKIPR